MKSEQASAGAAERPAAGAAPLRRFGRFELRALLSKTQRSMMWLVFDPRNAQEFMLAMPRQAPNRPEALAYWQAQVQAGARIQHPNLAHAVEVGQVEHWPYIAYDRALGETLEERLARQSALLPLDVAALLCQALEGLAFAHEAGYAHRDIQTSTLVIDASNHVRLLGLEVAQEVFPASIDFNTVTRQAVREAAEDDVLSMGLLLHRLLSARPVLDESDLQLARARLQPRGQELLRLGWENPHPIAEPLRAIVNRSTASQPAQRYHSARSLLRALDGWRSVASDQGGAVQLLLDRMQRVGSLPIASLRLQRAAQSTTMESTHTSEVAALVLQDIALSLELLRRVNHALRQEGLEPGGGTVLNMQRAIAMLGLNGLQQAARALKPWPAGMNDEQAARLQILMQRVRRAGEVAQALRPAGYDAEVVYLIAVMQNLGRLLLQYHFPDDAQQIRQLMRPPEPSEDNPHPQGLSEQSAAFAVLGCDLEALSVAVARQWGLGEELMHMIRRQGADVPVRSAHGDAELLRLSCSLANELIDALALPEDKRRAGVELATRRYARVLGLGLREVQQALLPPAQQPPQPPDAPSLVPTVTMPVQPSALRAKIGAEVPTRPPDEMP